MIKIAVISDIHSNIFALDAVLEDIKSKNVEMIVNLGDSLLGPVDPVNTAKRLMMADNIVNIMGNGDEKLLQNEISSPTAKHVKSILDEEILEWLKTFKRQWIYENILFCHGSPDSNSTYLIEEVTSIGINNKPIEKLHNEIKEIEQEYIICGHSHLGKAVYLSDKKMIINPGSVGQPAYSDDKPILFHVETFSPYAKYLIVSKQRDCICSMDHIQVRYDWNKSSEMAKKNGREDTAHVLRTGTVIK